MSERSHSMRVHIICRSTSQSHPQALLSDLGEGLVRQLNDLRADPRFKDEVVVVAAREADGGPIEQHALAVDRIIDIRQADSPLEGLRWCDNTSVGVIIRHPEDRYLLFDRNTPPPGVAPVAGHVDQHGGPTEAARAEAFEETGLTITGLTRCGGGWRANHCRRYPGQRGYGHQWTIYLAEAEGSLAPSPREVRNARWLTSGDLRALMERTLDHARGAISGQDFAGEPGLEPVWAQWCVDAGILRATAAELDEVEKLVCLPVVHG